MFLNHISWKEEETRPNWLLLPSQSVEFDMLWTEFEQDLVKKKKRKQTIESLQILTPKYDEEINIEMSENYWSS